MKITWLYDLAYFANRIVGSRVYCESQQFIIRASTTIVAIRRLPILEIGQSRRVCSKEDYRLTNLFVAIIESQNRDHRSFIAMLDYRVLPRWRWILLCIRTLFVTTYIYMYKDTYRMITYRTITRMIMIILYERYVVYISCMRLYCKYYCHLYMFVYARNSASIKTKA